MAHQGFGALLREHRQLAKLSQEELAHRAGLSPQAISLLERGARKHPRRQTIDAIVKALELGADDHAKLLNAARRNRTVSGPGRDSQLPQLTASFTGREADLRAVLDTLSKEPTKDPAVAIVAIDGMAGCGKTTLAIRAAHELDEQFPGGSLFIDLHGFTEGLSPADPFDALGFALRALGLPGQAIPDTLDERSALYRSTLAGRRVLVVLDNAAMSNQVIPLLPGTAGSAVIITTRTRQFGVAGARMVSLSPMETEDAKLLFTTLAGRVDDDQALEKLIGLCGNLPLAIEIAAVRTARDCYPLNELVQSLADRGGLLTASTEADSNLTAVFELSYRPLRADQQRVFRLMSLNPGPTMDEHAVAAACRLPLRAARIVLDELVDQHLIVEGEPAIYGFHDLIRSYALQLATSHESDAERADVVRALESHYLCMASRAMDLIYPAEANRRSEVALSATHLSILTEKASAEEWLDRETATLLRIAEVDDKLAMQVLGTVMRHLQTRGRWDDAGILLPASLRAAEQSGEAEQARATLHFALYRQIRGRPSDAADLYRRGLQLARASSWVVGQITSLLGLGEVERLTGRHASAADHYRAALQLADPIYDRAGQLRALLGLGDVQCAQGNFAEAQKSYQRCISVSQEIGDDFNLINAQVGLGDIDYDLGRFDASIVKYESALATADRVQYAPARHYALSSLASAYLQAGRYQDAIVRTVECLEYARTIGNRVLEAGNLLDLADCWLAVDHLDEAEPLLEQALSLAEAFGDWDYHGKAYRSQGLLLQARGQLILALDAFQASLQVTRPGEMPLEEARTHWAIATCLVDLGRIGDATPELEAAIRLFRAIGSPELDSVLALKARLQS